jgi:hypothetical protein
VYVVHTAYYGKIGTMSDNISSTTRLLDPLRVNEYTEIISILLNLLDDSHINSPSNLDDVVNVLKVMIRLELDMDYKVWCGEEPDGKLGSVPISSIIHHPSNPFAWVDITPPFTPQLRSYMNRVMTPQNIEEKVSTSLSDDGQIKLLAKMVSETISTYKLKLESLLKN